VEEMIGDGDARFALLAGMVMEINIKDVHVLARLSPTAGLYQ
jgi:hypothetical protein